MKRLSNLHKIIIFGYNLISSIIYIQDGKKMQGKMSKKLCQNEIKYQPSKSP